jgi:phospholipid/cholesterol/gamma-HCH transport system substrate-binding protein
MASKRSKFLIGLFVITGLLIGAIIIIWAGASDLFMKGSMYITYFDESVQGLQNDSAVKYRGVDIGKVESIKVAPDFRLVEVTMKINLAGDLQKQTFAQLRTAGITGIIFIELDRIREGIAVDFKSVNFPTNYPVIPSRRSDLNRFLADTNKIMQNLKEIDFKGISGQLIDTTKAIEIFVAGDRMNNIMDNLESVSTKLDKSASRVSKIIAEGKIETILKDTAATLADARGLIGRAKEEIAAMKLAEQSARSGEILETIDNRAKHITLELQDTSENLRVTSEYLQKLAESLNNNPSELIFSPPAPPRKKLE